MTGKEKCRLLKDIRKKTAEENGIPFETTECGFKGECKGTCPKCEAELKYINEQLERKRKFTKAAVAVAMSASLIFAAGCTPDEYIEGAPLEYPPGTEAVPEYTLEGDVPYLPEDQCDPEEEPILLEGDVVYVPEEE